MTSFSGKRAFITGGSSGIGKALALELVKQGAHVWIAARRVEVCEAAVAELRQHARTPDQRIGFVSLDVGDAAAVQAASQTVLEALGGLDLLVNNAGISKPAYLHETPLEDFERILRVNYFGTVNVTMAFLPHFMAQQSGHIANVGSTLSFVGIFGYAAYVSSKFAVNGFSEAIRQDLVPHNVGVTILYPADTDTPQLHEENKIKPAETKAVAGTAGLSQPEDVARALLRGIERGQFHVVPGLMNKVTWYACRFAPWLVRWVSDADVRKAARARQAAAQRG